MAKRARATRSDSLERIVRAALELAARQGWRETRMTDIAEVAGLSLQEVYRTTPSKLRVVSAFLRDIDSQMIAGDDAAVAVEPARDRLFDVIMRRFDLLNPHKEGIAAILKDARTRPFIWACAWPMFARSLAWMLETARIDHAGLSGMLRVEGLGLIMLGAFRVWLADDSQDMARTMAYVDRQLARADNVMTTLCRVATRQGPEEAVPETPS